MTSTTFLQSMGWLGVGLGALLLASCDGKTSAVAPRASASQPSSSFNIGGDRSVYRDPRDQPIPQINGKPLWAANRNHTAEENAEYQFTKNGADFAAKSESDYVAKAHAFVDQPPKTIETIDRQNGDKLMYDPKANVFAVVARSGAPRTMFKPRDGAVYWSQQKDRETSRSKATQLGSEQG